MAGIRLEWAQFGDFDSFSVLRSNSPMDIAALPSPIATGLATMYYVDTAIVDGAIYYYRILAVRDGVSKVSTELRAKASISYWDDVLLLIFADAASYPSTNFIDSSPAHRTITGRGGVRMTTPASGGEYPPKFSGGIIHLTAGGTGLYATIPQLLKSDFTFEFWGFMFGEYSRTNARMMQIGDMTQGSLIYELISQPSLKTGTSLIISGGTRVYPIVGNIQAGAGWGDHKHLCLMRKGGVFYQYVDGVLDGNSADYLDFEITGTTLNFACGNTGSNELSGYIDSLRLTKAAIYNEVGFSIPTEKFQLE